MASDLRQYGATSLRVWTLSANPIRQWYERLGGHYVAEQSLLFDGEPVVEVTYAWPDIDHLCRALAI